MIETCATLCAQSYDDRASGWTEVQDLRFGIFEHQGRRIICIRGTANAHNWLRDADCIPKRSCGGFLAHGGFIDAYRKLCAAGMPTAKDPGMVATGHSLGGAIATLLAEHTGCTLVTFGSPRVYWRFGSAPRIDHVRVCRDDDPVPQVPKILFSHRCDPLLLTDHDHHLLQVEDHFMAGYQRALASLKSLPSFSSLSAKGEAA